MSQRVFLTLFLIVFAFCSGAIFSVVLANADDAFLEWFATNGGILSGVSIASFADEGRGVVALNDTAKDKEIIFVPSRIIFSTAALSKSDDEIHKKLFRLFSSEDDVIRASLLVEKFRGASSFFAPYIAVLPTYVPSLIHFLETELSELQNDALKTEIMRSQAREQDEYKVFKDKLSTILPNNISSLITIEEFKWATSIVDSRGLRFRGKITLAPVADMFNYAPNPESRTAADGQYFLKHHKLDTDGSLRITADRDQVAGAQLYEDYGDNTDTIYLQHHGFVPNKNPFRCVPVVGPGKRTIGQDPEDFSEARKNLMKALQFERGPPSSCIESNGWLGKALDVYLISLAFTEEEVASCLDVIQAVSDGNGVVARGAWPMVFRDCMYDDVQKSLADARGKGLAAVETGGEATIIGDTEHVRALTARTLDQITAWLHSSLHGYPTTITEDEKALKSLNEKLAIALEKERLKMAAVVGATGAATVSASDLAKLKAELVLAQKLVRGNLHWILAVRYRLALKQQLLTIGRVYGVDLMVEKFAQGRRALASSTVFSTVAERRAASSEDAKTEEFDFPENLSTDYVDIEAERSILTLEKKIDLFNEWYASATPKSVGPLKVTATVIPGYRIGVIAAEDIKAEDVYLSVPVDVIIDTNKAVNDEQFGRLIDTLLKIYKRRDEYHEMLLFLIYERVVRHERSKFWPYLRLLPTPLETNAAVPTSWALDAIDSRIHPSAAAAGIALQRNRTERSYSAISRIRPIQAFFPKGMLTEELYRWATSILDSRTIWWDGKMHLVPMLDFINCKEGPNPSRVHATRLDASEMLAVTKAGWDFKIGEQVFENYGQSNYIYFMHHGFSLPPGENTHDCVLFVLSLTEAENNSLMSKEGPSLMQEVGKKLSSTRGTACLSWPIAEEVWLYLAVKLNQVKALKKKGLLGKPSKGAADLLAKLIDRRLVEYQQHEPLKSEVADVLGDVEEEEEEVAGTKPSTPHEATLVFLRSEIHTLKAIKSRLLELVKISTGSKGVEVDVRVDEL